MAEHMPTRRTTCVPPAPAPPAASLGGMAGAFYATNVGATTLFGIEGWRFAFHLVRAPWRGAPPPVCRYP